MSNARIQLQHSDKARTDLHQALEESARYTLEEAEKNKKYQDIIIIENKELTVKVTLEMGVIYQRQEDVDRWRETCG